MVASKHLKLPADLWAPLYDYCSYPIVAPLTRVIDTIMYEQRYRRACQRFYGDNRIDHIKPLKET